jgi:hypothetical protein
MTTQPGGTDPRVVVVRERGGWFGKFLVVIGLLGVLFAMWIGLAALNFLPSIFKNPFQKQVTEHTGPVLLESIEDAADFLAAKGSFQVVVDYEEGRQYIPSWVAGCKAIFVGYGEVDAYVDVSSLSENAIVISGDEVTITLPEPTLSDVDSDVTESYKISEDRGIVERFTGVFTDSAECVSTQELFKLAETKIAAAAEASDLKDRAEQNTRIWLEGMLKSIGFERATITFEPNPQ